jgi:hypothetical protein
MAKKQKIKQGTAVWINEIGAIDLRIFNVVNFNKEKNTLIISFGNNEEYEIKRHNIRANRCVIYKKGDGKIIVQNPDKLGLINLNEKNIKTLRFNLQNISLQESKSAIYRWTNPKDIVDKLGPIFKLLFICIAVGVIGWAAFKYAGVVLELITRSRLIECSQLFPNSPTPININLTNPLGT